MNARAMDRLGVGLPNDPFSINTSTFQMPGILGSGRVFLLNRLAGSTISMSRAVGSGTIYQFIVQLVPTSNAYIFNADPTTDTFFGSLGVNLTGSTATFFASGSTPASSNVVTLNGSTTGGAQIGDTFFVRDMAAGIWSIWGNLIGTGSVATPFS